MQRLQPHVEELKKKHGKERRRLTEETLKLYRQHRTKPVLGLIPLIVQIPVLIGLLWVLVSLGVTPSNAVLQSQALFHSWLFHSYHHGEMVYNLFHARFLWLTNGVGKRDPLYILPALAGATQWIQSRMMRQNAGPEHPPVGIAGPTGGLPIFIRGAIAPSGLSLYWVTSCTIAVIVAARITGWGWLPFTPHSSPPRMSPPRGPFSPGPSFEPPTPVPALPPSRPPLRSSSAEAEFRDEPESRSSFQPT